ncbi:MFS transporter [Sinomonas sp. JGH33]|uniref:MFS transporter n=1 Tax=Sinomonas terricola TaxID=3110330 RepID=A0ABU5T9D7_9MICC|nr:MFS transporter [Sinomonas sp. JGH33]MEA5456301.1 MFS transporter [Sinomonas sp. JGH33]
MQPEFNAPRSVIGSLEDRSGPEIIARLEGLPFTRLHKRVIAIVGTAYLFDAADVAILTFVLAPISAEFHLNPIQAGTVASTAFVGMAIGSIVAGWLSDRFGRRPIFTLSMLLWGLATLFTAFSWDYSSLLAGRFITGIGMAAELPCAMALASEYLPAKRRGPYLGSAQILVILSFLISGGITLLVGWRAAFMIMFVLSLFAFVVRRGIPESVRWQVAHSDLDGARATLSRFESTVPADLIAQVPPQPPAAGTMVPASRGPVRDLFARQQRKLTLTAWSMWFFQLLAQYGISIWIAKLLFDHGASITASIGITMLMQVWGIPGALISSLLLERLGRRPVYVASAILAGAAAFWYGNASTAVIAIVAGSVLNFFLSAMTAGINAYTPELFPTASRATGTGTASAAGRVSSVIGPLVVPVILVTWGYAATFLVLSLCFLIAAGVVLVLGRETRGKSLEAIAVDASE